MIYRKLLPLTQKKNRKCEWSNFIKEIELIFINFPTKKPPHPDNFTSQFIPEFKQEITAV